jgi:glucose/arabinose dehydrogenase
MMRSPGRLPRGRDGAVVLGAVAARAVLVGPQALAGGQPRQVIGHGGFQIGAGAARFARLAGMAVMPAGSLPASDDTNGVIYRITRGGAG